MTRLFSWRQFSSAAPLWALAGILLSAAWSRAEDAPEQPRHMENRFLFVIDTSSAMKARTNGIEEAVLGLLASGMKGELRQGDTIGVWTYSDRLDTEFPKQVWSEQGKDDIVDAVRDHLHELHYGKRAHLEKALPVINRVVAHSERLTVILIFDGSDPIKGTPFDKDINDLDKKYVHEFKAAHEPFVTLLAARNGAVFDYTINYPGTVIVPPTADPLPPPPETNAPPPPPVIAGPPPAPKPPPRRIEITLSGSNFAHHASAPPPAVSNPVAVVVPAPAVVPAIVSNAPPPAVAAPVVVQAANTNVALAEPASPLPPPASAPPSAPVVKAPAKPVPLAPPAAAVIPVVVPASTGQQMAMFVIAFSLLTIAVVLVLFLVRRSKAGSQPSLISQSIDRAR